VAEPPDRYPIEKGVGEMLYTLHVKNLALIEEQEIEFTKGLNILTGETGAGKSIILGSVNLALGAKADKELIRDGAEYALIELTFFVDDKKTREKIKALDIDVDDEGIVVLSRKILPTRSICKIAGESVSLHTLREVGNILINIHGQKDNQILTSRSKQQEILDDFCKDDTAPYKEKLKDILTEYKSVKAKYEETNIDEQTRKRAEDLARYEFEEIEEASLQKDEDITLEARYKKMTNSMKLANIFAQASDALFENESGNAASSISFVLSKVMTLSGIDSETDEIIKQINDIDILMTDLSHSLSSYMSDMEFDDEDFKEVEDRLNLINHLKDKYGNSIENILEYKSKKEEELEVLSNIEAERQKLYKKMQELEKNALDISHEISKIRSKHAGVFSKKMKEAMESLNFIDVEFDTLVTPGDSIDSVTSNGYDKIVFMISTNPGEKLRPMDEIASGGELSRIMLALKTIMAGKDDIESLIFDEIDAGISGITAWKVAEKLGMLSLSHQVICITHLPQIASMADSHFMIQKNTEDGRTTTRIDRLKDDAKDLELGRLLGAGEVTNAVLSNAKEMREKADEFKSSITV